MRFEVEQKHRLNDVAAFVVRLAEQGVRPEPPVVQSDLYYAHPARDFAATDEALRIRSVAGASFVTYKGPKLDAATKTRREIELPLDSQDADGARFGALLEALGFMPVATVRKERRKFAIRRQGYDVEGAIDCVEGVGDYVELELMADEHELESAKRAIRQLAIELELGPSERRSYLEMLLGR